MGAFLVVLAPWYAEPMNQRFPKAGYVKANNAKKKALLALPYPKIGAGLRR